MIECVCPTSAALTTYVVENGRQIPSGELEFVPKQLRNVPGGGELPGGLRLRFVTTLVTVPFGISKYPSPLRNKQFPGSPEFKPTRVIVIVFPTTTFDPEIGKMTGVAANAFPHVCANSSRSVSRNANKPTMTKMLSLY